MRKSHLYIILISSVIITFANLAIAQVNNSPELELLKTLEGRWEGMTTPGLTQTEAMEAVVTYKLTGRGTAVIETLFFPSTNIEMTTVYYDDPNGQLVMTHYCSAGNQPFLSLLQSSNNQLQFELSPNDQTIDVENEWHAHGLINTVNEDGTLTQVWQYWLKGQHQSDRNLQLVKVE